MGPARNPTRHDIQLAQTEAGLRRFVAGCDLIKHIASTIGWVGGLWLIVSGLVSISRATPGSLHALAEFVKAWPIDRVVLALGNVAFGGLYIRERRGKKRVTALKGKYQHIVEQNDPGRTSSGLTPTGDTP